MKIRRSSRELAMQALFYMDINGEYSEPMIARFCQVFPPSKKSDPFFHQILSGVIEKRLEIDTVIERFSSNWKMNRMACVDRNIMRIAVYEIMYCQDIPPKVSINEAIDIGKKYGTEDSGAFINGILDSIRIAIEKGDSLTANQYSNNICKEELWRPGK
jgi:N utilization substance protein B